MSRIDKLARPNETRPNNMRRGVALKMRIAWQEAADTDSVRENDSEVGARNEPAAIRPCGAILRWWGHMRSSNRLDMAAVYVVAGQRC